MQMSPPVNRTSLSNNEIGPTCRFLNWSQACPGQMCNQEHVVLVSAAGAAMPMPLGRGGRGNHGTATAEITGSGWRASPGLRLSHVQYPHPSGRWGESPRCPPKPAPEADLEWPPWSGWGKAHFKLAVLRVLTDALTAICDSAGTQVTPHLERFGLPSFIQRVNPPEVQSKEWKLMLHVLYYPLGILGKCGCHYWQWGAEFTALISTTWEASQCLLLPT